jgi:Helicase associated domain
MSRPKHRRTAYFVGLNLFDRLEGFTDLEARIAALPTERDRGHAFEVFAQAYLATQKLVGAEEVWPDDQVPIAVLRECRLPIKDMGADGVYKTSTGQYNAYQSKFRTGRPKLAWQELSTFMGLTDQVGERVLFTNCDDLSEIMDDRSGFFCVRGNDLDRLTKDDLKAIADWLRGAAYTPKRKDPLPHQLEALEDILNGAPHREKWEIGFSRLKEYAERESDSQVRQDYRTEDGYALGAWVAMQRFLFKKNKLNPECRRRLEALPDWSWQLKKSPKGQTSPLAAE